MSFGDRQAEVDLARAVQAGDLAAFDRFVEGFRSKLLNYSLLVCGQREDAEEVAQDALVKVFENFQKLREPEKVRSWVFRIARNACLMKRRKSVFAPAQELSLDEILAVPGKAGEGRRREAIDSSKLPDANVLHEELKDELRSAIGSLPPIYKTVLLLRDVEELSTEQAAQILHVSEDVVKTRLHRAHTALRKKLEGYIQARVTPVTASRNSSR